MCGGLLSAGQILVLRNFRRRNRKRLWVFGFFFWLAIWYDDWTILYDDWGLTGWSAFGVQILSDDPNALLTIQPPDSACGEMTL